MRRSMSTTSGRSAATSSQCLRAVGRGADDLDLLAYLEERGQRLTEQGLVVDHQHPHGPVGAHPGSSTRTARTAARCRLDREESRRDDRRARGCRPARTRRRRRVDAAPVVADLQTAPRPAGRPAGARRRGRSRACGCWSGPPGRPGRAPPGRRCRVGVRTLRPPPRWTAPAPQLSSSQRPQLVRERLARRRARAGRPPTRGPTVNAWRAWSSAWLEQAVGPDRVAAQHRPRGLDLHPDHREVVPQPVVDVPGHPGAFPHRRQLLDLGAELAQPAVGHGQLGPGLLLTQVQARPGRRRRNTQAPC